MNAQQAAAISNSNQQQIANSRLQNAISDMEQNIRAGADRGEFEAEIKVRLIEAWIKFHNTDQLEQYFLAKNFEVCAEEDFNDYLTFQVRWHQTQK